MTEIGIEDTMAILRSLEEIEEILIAILCTLGFIIMCKSIKWIIRIITKITKK